MTVPARGTESLAVAGVSPGFTQKNHRPSRRLFPEREGGLRLGRYVAVEIAEEFVVGEFFCCRVEFGRCRSPAEDGDFGLAAGEVDAGERGTIQCRVVMSPCL